MRSQTTWVWADSITTGRCRDSRCGETLTFATNCRTGKQMPFTGELVALQTRTDPGTYRQQMEVDLSTSHFQTCVGAKDFRRGKS